MKLRKGITLVEIVAVIALIAIISLVAVNAFRNLNEGARVAALDVSHDAIVTAVRMYQASSGGSAPTTVAALVPFLEEVTDAAGITDLIVRIGAGTSNPTALTITFPNPGEVSIVSTITVSRPFNGRIGTYAGGTYTRTNIIS